MDPMMASEQQDAQPSNTTTVVASTQPPIAESSTPLTTTSAGSDGQVKRRYGWAFAIALGLFVLIDPIGILPQRARLRKGSDLEIMPSGPTAVPALSPSLASSLLTTLPPTVAPTTPAPTQGVRFGRGFENEVLAAEAERIPDAALKVFSAAAVASPVTAAALVDVPVARRWNPAEKTSRPRVLQTEFFAPKYGLTNLMMASAAMIAYGSADARAVHFPIRSPIDMEDLLDIQATEAQLRSVNVVILTHNEFNEHYSAERQVRARKLGLSFGYRNVLGSANFDTAMQSFASIRMGMTSTKQTTVLTHRDFFLSFPFRATSPFDMCFYMKRLVYHERIRRTAASLASSILKKVGGKNHRIMAWHLRLEGDVVMLRKQAAAISPQRLERFIRTRILKIANATRVSAIYVCAGKLKAEYMDVFRNTDFGIPFFFKQDFPDVKVPIVAENVTVTSHVGAAVDALIISHATVAVTFQPSTYTLNAVTARCPSPSRKDARESIAAARQLMTWEGLGQSDLVTPDPKDVPLTINMSSTTGGPAVAFEGVLTYDFTDEGDFTGLRYIACEDHYNWCRYNPSM